MTTRDAIRNEIDKCSDPGLHPTWHPKECICDHCWEEEMCLRMIFGRKLTTKVVWKSRKSEGGPNTGRKQHGNLNR